MGRRIAVLIILSLLCLGSMAPMGGSDHVRQERGPDSTRGDSDSWTIPFRERLKDKFLRCLRSLGQYHQDMGEKEKAIYFYEIALSIDPGIDFARESLQKLQ